MTRKNASPSPHGPAPGLVASVDADGGSRVEVVGAWHLAGLRGRIKRLNAQLARYATAGEQQWHWDLSQVSVLDTAGALLLWQAWGGRPAASLSLRPEHEILFVQLAQSAQTKPAATPARDRAAPVIWLGIRLLALFDHVVDIIVLLGRVVFDVLYMARHPSRVPWRELSANVFRTGAQALGITALVGFLVGVVLSYLSSNQLKQFGADIFIINLLGISVVRELGPMLAAILVAGRSGSSMTAQLGIMRVTQELDAMSVMGIPYSLRLIAPKVIGLAIALPLIVLWTNAIALIGGMITAHLQLGIDMHFFLERLPGAVPIANLWMGLIKGMVFGATIALIACHFGLRIRPNTESLGIGTTASVVASITMVIVLDAIFAVVFSDVGVP
ncbi:MAG TPA: ABC transporter permease [Burkholderiales bacterium]|jgi:phospholipid/cholesterol/gamma-HCH transport system permease protein|nr:ABC transporter permease [Burkholderiales bacterium]